MKNLGRKAKDKLTGYEGLITIKQIHITGCIQYYLLPMVDKKGDRRKGEWFDKGRLEIGERALNPEDVQAPEYGYNFKECKTYNE